MSAAFNDKDMVSFFAEQVGIKKLHKEVEELLQGELEARVHEIIQVINQCSLIPGSQEDNAALEEGLLEDGRYHDGHGETERAKRVWVPLLRALHLREGP